MCSFDFDTMEIISQGDLTDKQDDREEDLQSLIRYDLKVRRLRLNILNDCLDTGTKLRWMD